MKNFFLLLAPIFLSLVCALSSPSGVDGFSVSLKRNPNYRARSVANTRLVTVTSDRYDHEFVGEVNFGTPPQPLRVIFTTGGITDSWLLSEGHHLYNTDLSTSAQIIDNRPYTISYGLSTNITATLWQDVVSLNSLEIPHALIGVASDVRGTAQRPYSDGMFGLALKAPGDAPTSRDTALSRLLPQLSEQLFTANLPSSPSKEGYFTFGYIPDGVAQEDIFYTPLLANAALWDFNFKVQGYGDDSAAYLHGTLQTGTGPYNYLPHEIVGKYYNNVPGARYLPLQEAWVFPCDQPLPDFTVGFDGTPRTVTVPGQLLNVIAGPDTDSNGSTVWVCVGGIQPIQSDMDQGISILADSFIKSVLVVFDVGNQRLGFASKAL
ncbi:aspartic peptidase domain-containing protein [Bombardia bombarda]|uniref:Aspartic peptidase domain-containing protein n=1 Tax=Bombardia bombarda TaxID=252184 RepID=A0AA40CEE3_9PEZI|nr:aspartic peptidase domain-containing protein [Bombardia bombarda]